MFKDNPDFYPTPIHLIRKMLSYCDLRTVRTILEPSSGKGDIVEYLNNQTKNNSSYYRQSHKLDIDCIEQDSNLIHVLRGKNFRVVHDDFLSYNSFKKYDLVIMNPPYSQGDKHLLKAIELQQRGGKIICLLNGETLKNPYSNTRKELIRQLEKYDAKVEYVENAFSSAERKTDVLTAIVFIDIPKVEYDSTIIQQLQKEKEIQNLNEYQSTTLIESDFIKGIVSQFEYEVKAGLKLIQEYNALRPLMLRSFDSDSPVLKLELEYKDNEGSTLENAYIKQIRSKYWKALFNNDQFMGLFTSNLRAKYMEMVEELKDYDFSFYNIYTLRIQLSKEMVQGVEDTILSLFEEFSYKHYYDEMSKNIHYFSGWRTNKSYKVNSRVIIPLNGFYDLQYSWGRYEPSHFKVIDKLKDIEKVFNYLDSGLTEEVDMKEVLLNAEKLGQTKKIRLKYFYVTFFKKGTCHIEFINDEILQKFNLFGSQKKGHLPPSYGKTKYKDMTKEERDVIDQFEGEKSYNKVMSNLGYYLVKTEELLRLTS